MFELCEARPDLSGALFVRSPSAKLRMRRAKKRERRAEIGAQIIVLEGLRVGEFVGLWICGFVGWKVLFHKKT